MGQNRFAINFLTIFLIHFDKIASHKSLLLDFKQVFYKSAVFTKGLFIFRLDEPYLLYRVKVKLRFIHNKIFV